MHTKLAKIACALLLVLSLGGAAAAGEAKSPIGFKLFCAKNPAQCQAASVGSIKLDDGVMAQLKSVNSAVNRAISPRNEARGKDVWLLEARIGDCEDYVVTKRARLIRMGLPPGALRIAFAKTRSGEGHAVLIVRTTKGDYVLDNRTSAIRPMSQTGLRFISMSTANPKKWVAA